MALSRDYLLKALRHALWGNTFEEEINKDLFFHVMSLADEQVVAGLVFDVLSSQKTQIGFDATLAYIGQNVQIRSANSSLNDELKKFVKAAEDNKFDCIIVKGQTVGCLYPNPELRVSGDIDVFLKDEYSKSKRILERMMAVDLPEKLLEKELSFFHGETRFDVHSNIVDFCCSKHQHYWDGMIKQIWDGCFFVEIEGVKVRTLPPTINAIYVFLHLFYHFIREGVALRQFCDWAMVLHSYKDKIDRGMLFDMLDGLGVVKAYRAFGTVIVDELGLAVDEFPIPLNDNDRKWKGMILDDVFKGGNFGRKNHLSTSTIGYKMETMRLIVKNNLRYYGLAPAEMRMMIPKLIGINLKLLIG